MKLFLTVLVSIVILSACTAHKKLYYWGKYSSSLYSLKKAPGDENLQKYKQTLIEIINKSEKKNKKVPPGLYCEYAYILLKEGNVNDALNYFSLEEKTYPESKLFIEKIKKKIVQTEEQ